MMEREDIVAAVVDAAGGELVGRVRLQKAVYLLDQLGLGSGFEYEYHHYGPYSRELDFATADAEMLNVVHEELQHRESDGARYSVFRLGDWKPKDEAIFGHLGRAEAARLARLFATTNITVLELAATVDWLWRKEECGDWPAEVARRKPMKVGNDRLERAIDLLKKVGLTPPGISPSPAHRHV